MKTIYFLPLLILSVGVKAQWVSIPDTNFGTWLNENGYSTCMQGNNGVGWQMDTSCPAVVNATLLNCNGGYIRDLTGIQYFNNLSTLGCCCNQLSLLPALPNSLINLDCHNNLLSSLPPLPNNLTRLECEYNHLNNLPTLPNFLTEFFCHNNQITELPVLPDSLYWCYINNNPINCIPQLKRIVDFKFSNTSINCLPNYGNISYSTPALNTLPLCDIFNSNGCEIFSNISGKVYVETDPNCIQDSAESGLKNIPVKLWYNNALEQQMPSVGLGSYSFITDSLGIYNISVDFSVLPFQPLCPTNGINLSVVYPPDTIFNNKDFAVGCKLIDLAAWSIEGRFRPGTTRKVDIHVGSASNFYGVNCAAGMGISGNVRIEIAGPASYVSPAPGALTPDDVSDNILTFNVADIGSVDFNNSFNIMVQTDTTAPIGSTICFTVTVTPITGDDMPTNNIQTHCFVVVRAIDPNDKEVYPLNNVNSDEWLSYTINFQNTGTDTAQHIYVTDTLDSDLDYSSFQLLAYSHQPLMQIKENLVRFNFPNINLPDSNINEPLSHGYVQYKIKLKDNLLVGTAIDNTAFIYFDFNAPVVTNTTSNTVTVATIVSNFQSETFNFYLFPNPAKNTLNVTGDANVIGSTLTIYDMTGRKLTAIFLTAEHSEINTESISDGVYIAEIKRKDVSVMKKWTKM